MTDQYQTFPQIARARAHTRRAAGKSAADWYADLLEDFFTGRLIRASIPVFLRSQTGAPDNRENTRLRDEGHTLGRLGVTYLEDGTPVGQRVVWKGIDRKDLIETLGMCGWLPFSPVIETNRAGEGVVVNVDRYALVVPAKWHKLAKQTYLDNLSLRLSDAASWPLSATGQPALRRGRRPGDGTFDDSAALAEMERLIKSGEAKSVHDAALRASRLARKTGTDESTVRRLSKKWKKRESVDK